MSTNSNKISPGGLIAIAASRKSLKPTKAETKKQCDELAYFLLTVYRKRTKKLT